MPQGPLWPLPVFEACMSVPFSLFISYPIIYYLNRAFWSVTPCWWAQCWWGQSRLLESEIYGDMIPCGWVGNKRVVGNPVRSEYNCCFRITRAGGGVERDIWKDSVPPESPYSDLWRPSLLLLCWFHTFLPSPTLSSYWLIEFFVPHRNPCYVPPNVPYKQRDYGCWVQWPT